MVDAKAFVKTLANVSKQFRMTYRFVMTDVRGKRIDAGGDGPDMKIVNTAHTGRSQYLGLNLGSAYMPGRAFKKYVDRFQYQTPCADHYDKTDDHAADGVRSQNTECNDQYASNYRDNRSQ
jgi:hypothetical protein